MDLSARRQSLPDPSATAAVTLTAMLACEADLDALERSLLAAMGHAEGANAAGAWMLRWNARRGLLEGWRAVESLANADELSAALGAARRAAPVETSLDARARAWAVPADQLEGALGAAWRSGEPAEGSAADQPGAPWNDAERIWCVPLRRGPAPFGVLLVAWNDEPSCAAGIARLTWLREAALAALAAQGRAAEARRRSRQAAALAEFTHASNSAINVAEANHLLARLSTQGVAARGSAVYRPGGSEWSVVVAHGPAALRDGFARGFLPTVLECARQSQPLSGDSPTDATELPANIVGETSVWAALPLIAYGRVLGVLVVHDGLERESGWERGDLEFLGVLADSAALLLEHARRLEELERGERQRADLAARLREQDRMASLGELAARVAQESRNPLASISAFARRAHRALGEDDPQREYLEIVVREAERLEAMLLEQSAYAQLEKPRLRMENLNAAVQLALQRASETLVRRRVRLLKKLAPDLPQLLLDSPRIQRVVENVVAFALESVPVGGRIRVETRRAQAFAMIEIAHDGARQGGDLLEHLFVPFAQGQPAGAAVGLGVAQQIVREHGGEVRVRSEGEWGTVFSFTLPVMENQDRRHASERRGSRLDRRRRAPEDGSAS